eukprot:gene6594-biopygen4192
MLSTAGHGKAVKEGPKVDKLQVPLFPWSDHVLRELNTKILDAVASVRTLEGGALPSPAADKTHQMFASEASVLQIPNTLEGGAAPLPVLDATGNPIDFYVDVQQIEDACKAISKAYTSNDEELFSYIKILESKVIALMNRHPSTRKVQYVHHYDAPYDDYGRPRRNRAGPRGRGGRGGAYRGGSPDMGETYPKND